MGQLKANKTMKSYLVLVLMAAVSQFSMGCAKGKVSKVTPVAPIVTPDVVGTVPVAPNGTTVVDEDYLAEREADFTPISDDLLKEMMVGRPPLNNPERHQISVNVQEMYNNNFGGQVRVTYYDNGVKHEEVYTSGDRAADIKYNEWFDFGAKEVFHGYFSGRFGAIILVVDDVIDLGDGGGDQVLAGKVYFMLFEPTRAPQSPTRCWNIEYGPYACGANFSGMTPQGVINHDYPGKSYKLVGTFKGLSRAKGFNTDFNP